MRSDYIRIVSNGNIFFRDANEDIAAFSASPLLTGGISHEAGIPMTDWQWSMMRYVNKHNSDPNPSETEKEAWDELEKSVVSHVADDVKISIKGWETEMILEKKITAQA